MNVQDLICSGRETFTRNGWPHNAVGCFVWSSSFSILLTDLTFSSSIVFILENIRFLPRVRGNRQSVKPIGCFSRGYRCSTFDVWQYSKCNTLILCRRRFPPIGLHKGILNSPCLLILLIRTKDKDNEVKILDWTYVLISSKENSSTG